MGEQPTARIAMVTLDCREVGPSAEFWSGLLGWEVAASSDLYLGVFPVLRRGFRVP